MTKTTSAPAAASAGLSAQRAPRPTSSSAVARVREWTVREGPAARRGPAIGRPLIPRPMKERFLSTYIRDFEGNERVRACSSFLLHKSCLCLPAKEVLDGQRRRSELRNALRRQGDEVRGTTRHLRVLPWDRLRVVRLLPLRRPRAVLCQA